MKFTRVLFGVFALLLSSATITLVSQEKHSPTPVGYTYAPTSEQTTARLGGGVKRFSVSRDRHSGFAHHGKK